MASQPMKLRRRARRVALLVVSLSMVAWALPAASADESKRNPIAVPGTPWGFDGFIVNIPADPDWKSLAKDGQYADLAKEYPDDVSAAAIVEARKVEPGIAGQDALLKLVEEEQKALPDPATKLLDYSAEAYSPKGALCARFKAKFEDSRTSTAAPGILLVRGMSCVRPDVAEMVVTVRYAQRSNLTDIAPAVAQALEPFVASLRFLPSDGKIIQQARLVVRGEKPGDAIPLLTPLAEQGDREAALFLGNLYLYGHTGVESNYALAKRWLELAAKDGRSDALYNLGAMYDKAIGVTRDPAEAVRWFTLAADQRDPQAQLNLAIFYLKGDGVGKDPAQAEQWLQRAAGNGNKRAEGILAAKKLKQQ